MPNSSIPKPAIRRLRVLYAEDLPPLRELMHLLLDPERHRLETCANGRLALEQLCRDPSAIDLLITDHHMPVMNGLDLVRAVRRLPFAGRIVVFSSELSPQVHDEYTVLGVDRVLPKPIPPATLRNLLAELFPMSEPEVQPEGIHGL